MPAVIISILKWLATTILIPLIEKGVAAWFKSREKAAKIKDKIRANRQKTEAYEKDPTDDSFGNLP